MSPQDQKEKFEIAFKQLLEEAEINDWHGQFNWQDLPGTNPSIPTIDDIIKKLPIKFKDKFVTLKNKLRNRSFE